MKIYFLVAALALPVTAAVAQRSAKQDYVVTAAGDTLRGEILIKDQGKGVKLRRADGERIKLGPAEARSYGDAAGVLGLSRNVGPHGILQFVVPLVQGPVSLYSGAGPRGKRSYFLQVPDTTYLIEIQPEIAQLTFHRLLPGCATMQFGTDATRRRYPIRYSGLSRLVMDYNACSQPQRPSHLIKGASGVRFVYGLKAGLNVSNFKLSFDLPPTEQKQATGYQAGLFLRASNKTRFSLLLEANYTYLRSTYESDNNPSNLVTRVVSIDYTQIQLPLLMRYTFGNGLIRPFLNAGGMFAINLNNKSLETFSLNSQPLEKSRQPINTSEDIGYGVTAGAGTTIRYASLPELSFEVRYDRMRYGNFIYFVPRHSSIRFDVSVGF